ncbi:DUF4244 domain-containing protein [Nonomuraea zeae]|uniref:DUF4244 domain-containing protein n=1 Tax=Nonomuraea zeae TaxID=1642303 RepID=A0A5S4FBI6_9ACTN|nr:DUF4244 domain-containing protein [Nonomuraea zeae]TMR15283.1 DUF4244 domain-containing protein [Nonomuraea zeae]
MQSPAITPDDDIKAAPTTPRHRSHLIPARPIALGHGQADTSTRRFDKRRFGKWLHYAAANRERGMSTAEYAVGTIAACAFAALLFKVVSSPEVQEMLTALIDRALKTTD